LCISRLSLFGIQYHRALRLLTRPFLPRHRNRSCRRKNRPFPTHQRPIPACRLSHHQIPTNQNRSPRDLRAPILCHPQTGTGFSATPPLSFLRALVRVPLHHGNRKRALVFATAAILLVLGGVYLWGPPSVPSGKSLSLPYRTQISANSRMPLTATAIFPGWCCCCPRLDQPVCGGHPQRSNSLRGFQTAECDSFGIRNILSAEN